jgi:cytochrome c-type biogenesis protein
MVLGTGTVFLAGLLTFASPCVMPLVPIYLSVLLGGSLDDVSGPKARLRLLLNGAMFVLGFLAVFVVLGLTATALGKTLLMHRLLVQQIGGMLVFFFGLKFLGLIRLDVMDREKRFRLAPGNKRIGPVMALLIGVAFAFGWTPCVGPILGSILTYTAVTANSLTAGATLLLVYGLGIGLPLLLVALFAQQGVTLLRKISRHLPKLEKVTGVILVVLSVLMVTDSLSALSFSMDAGTSDRISQEMSGPSRHSETGAGTTTISRLTTSMAKDLRPEGSATAPVSATADALPTTPEPRLDLPGPADPAGTSCGASKVACDADLGEPSVFVPASTTGGPGGLLPIPAGASLLGPMALEFVQPNCSACKQMVPLIHAMRRTCSGKGLPVETLDITIPENREFARQMGIVGTPTLVLIDASGKEVARLVGLQTLQALHQAVAIVVGEACGQFSRLDD